MFWLSINPCYAYYNTTPNQKAPQHKSLKFSLKYFLSKNHSFDVLLFATTKKKKRIVPGVPFKGSFSKTKIKFQ